jgi:hypothetical protein
MPAGWWQFEISQFLTAGSEEVYAWPGDETASSLHAREGNAMRSAISGSIGFALGIICGLLLSVLTQPSRTQDLEEQATLATKKLAAAEDRAKGLESQLRTAASRPVANTKAPSDRGTFQHDVEFALAFDETVTIDSIRKTLAEQSQVKAWRALKVEKEFYPDALAAAVGRSAPNDRCWLGDCDGGKLSISVDSFHGRVYEIDVSWAAANPDADNARALVGLIWRDVLNGNPAEADAIAAAMCGDVNLPKREGFGLFAPVYHPKSGRATVELRTRDDHPEVGTIVDVIFRRDTN